MKTKFYFCDGRGCRSMMAAFLALSATSTATAGVTDANWLDLGQVMRASVYCLACDVAGNVYAGGAFMWAGGETVNYIARQNATNWTSLSGGVGPVFSEVGALAVDSAGDVYAGGELTTAGGVAAESIAKWNGSNWSSLGAGLGGNGQVASLAFDDVGNLYAGGNFTNIGGIAANGIAKWNGSTWTNLGPGMSGNNPADTYVNAMAFDPLGNLYAGGRFANAGGTNATNIAQWNGRSWLTVGSGLNGQVFCLVMSRAGVLYAGGAFTEAGLVSAAYLAKWDGSNWTALKSQLNGAVYALTFDSAGNLFAGGDFTTAGGLTVNYIAEWNGTNWMSLGSGMSASVAALAISPAGNLYAGGAFASAGNQSSYYFAEALLSKSAYDLTLTRFGGETNVISAVATPGYSYALDMTKSLASPAQWVAQATNTIASTNLVFTNTATFPYEFFRVRCTSP